MSWLVDVGSVCVIDDERGDLQVQIGGGRVLIKR